MSIGGITYFLAVGFWLATACYGVLASQAFVQEQFLTPKLFDPLAIFAERHGLISVLLLGGWIAARIRRPHRPSPRWTWTTAMVWLAATAWLTIAAPLAEPHTTEEALLITGAGVTLLFLLAAAELPALDTRPSLARDRSRADLSACLLAAATAFVAHGSASAWLESQSAVSVGEMLQTLRLHLLMAATVFLALSAVRGAAGLTSRPVLAELVLTVGVLAAALTVFVSTVFLASLSIRGLLATGIALAIGTALACVIGIRAAGADAMNDGVAEICGVLSPGLTTRWWGFALWAVCLVGLAVSFAVSSRTADWSFVVLRSGIALIWLLSLAPAVTFTRRMADGGARLSFALVAAVLAGHLTLQVAVAPVHASSLRNASGKWLAEMLERGRLPEGSSDLVRLLHASTNIPRATQVAAVDVSLAELSGSPATVRPHVFVLLVDSLRRDYLSPYNPAVTFTPRLEALARDSLVFRNAFTQYGATGLSIPSIWVGGPILHKQYVTSFPKMNTLGKLLAHEQYEQWVGMDHIMETVLAPSDRRAPLDAGTPVKEFRLCKTLAEIRARLGQRPTDAPPVFAYSLPQDVHVSVINREGARAIDDADYSGFYAPVASRVRRLDQCLGEFVDDLKAKGLYDRSVIVLTSDHGDSLGEDGRMGHAYSLHPEIVRVPLIVHVPPDLRSAWRWDEHRAAYTTDITPTLYRLLGHEVAAPASFFGTALAVPPGTPPASGGPRMVAASYGAVYGALLEDASRYYVFDAIAMRELAFELGPGLEQRQVPVTMELQARGRQTIRDTVEAIGRFYRFSTAPDSGP
jgi:arylsulfatase A-like enzyme